MSDFETTVSPTAIDGYRYYCDSDSMTLDDFMLRLLRLEPPNELMTIGIDFHRMCEDAAQKYLSKGRFTPDESKRKYSFEWKCSAATIMPTVTEVPVRRTEKINDWKVTVSGRLDAVSGSTGIDYKTAWKPIDAESYVDAFQWRMYLYLMPELRDFRYDVFRVKNGRLLREIEVIEHRHFTMSRYPALEQEVEAAIIEYIEFLRMLERKRYIRITPYGVEQWEYKPPRKDDEAGKD